MEDVTEFLKGLFDTSLWPRRWACGEWSDFHGWLYIVSDFLIGLAYTGIPIVIATYVLKKHKNVQFRMVFWLFSAFILLCGLTHFMDATIFWWPAYRLSAVIRFITAIVSLATLVALFKLMPEILGLKTSKEFQAELLQRIKAEEELIKKNDEIIRLNRILETRMYFLAESMPLLVWTTDAEGKADYFNKNFLKYTGKTLEELNGFKWADIVCDEDLEETMKAWQHAVKNKTFYKVEQRLKSHNNSYRYFMTYGNPMLDDKGNVMMWVGANIDIQERKVSEEYLITSHEELKKLNSELDDFVYSISHDLRAPLTNIMGMAAVGLSVENLIMKNEIYNKIHNSAKRLDDYILNVLDYSRNSRLDLERDKIDFKQIVSTHFENYNFLKGSDKIKVKFDIKDDTEFWSDKRRIEAVFNNLISNAIKYADLTKPEPCITVSVEVNEEEATIILEDNGIGIEQDQLNKIFEIFYRGTQYASGSGLGLYIVKEIIEKLKGKIKVTSQLGVGTTFLIKLPQINEEKRG
jgi:PAS domain S-box-containing protein